ncbi:LuxR family transcriptional regulator [uncultured Slackia sp.]|uniref:helix-turn-helix transcriptional regulator n=1 Tax=uncultured Slackia sp. TaxID=665903 RepID=UPI0025F582AF|nr:LuxR family transcriptional regulator [uncultured Slackia sp.]
MYLVLFYYTLCILLISVMAAALCFSTYLVSRKRALLYAFLGFVFYFFDVALVFQDDFVLYSAGESLQMVHFVGAPLPAVFTGAGIIEAAWLVICDFFNEKRRAIVLAPCVFFIVWSVAVLILIPPGSVHQFLFYSVREICIYAFLVYLGFRYVTSSELTRDRMRSAIPLFIAVWILTTLIVTENIVFMFLVDPEVFRSGLIPFLPERNIAENMLMIACAASAVSYCWGRLAIHFKTPPIGGGSRLDAFIDETLPRYAHFYNLTARETEVLREILTGKDNQNIASEMSLAPSTVKVHVHNILRKTGQKDRQHLMRDFSRRA